MDIRKCPKCKKEYSEKPAISRKDNKTEICPTCGYQEAIEAFKKHYELASSQKVAEK